MKNLLFLTVLLLLSGLQVSAQSSVQSPPEVKSENKTAKFDSAEGGFRIDFPSKPTRTVRTINGAYGETPAINFQALSDEAGFIVAYTDLPALLKEKVEIETQLDGVKQRFLNLKNSRLVKEEEIKIGDNFAKEYIFETDEITVFTRGLIAGQRFFHITFMLPFILSKLPDHEKTLILTRAEKFFSSFEITKLPDFVDKGKNLPEDLGLEIEGNVLRSKYLKIEMELPENWYFIDNLNSDSVKGILQEEIDSSNPKAREELALSIKNTRVLVVMSKNKFESNRLSASMTIAVEKMLFPNTLPEVIIKYFQENSLDKNEKITKPMTISNFGGKKFAWVEYFNSKDKTRERFYVVNVEGLALEIFMVYKTEADLKKMLGSLETIRFLK